MQLVTTSSAMRRLARTARQAEQRLALVPTMGALHEGHLALVEEARRRAEHVTVSIFVNPTQFGPGEDFDAYPRELEADLERLREVGGVAAVFAPTAAALYPHGVGAQRVWVVPEELDEALCGAFRSGHFRGVATVVTKLFNCCLPDVAVFGLKDAQQFVILRRMVEDLCMDIELVGVPTVRETDGLARSSRNRYLTAEERAQAQVLSQAVEGARKRIREGEQHPQAVVEAMRETLGAAPDAQVQYAEVVDATTLHPLTRFEPDREVLAAVAVFFGSTRLIDSAFVRVPA